MKKLLALASCAIVGLAGNAQDFPGYRFGNFTGVNGVFFNPANIADSRYRFDINLFSVSTFVGNDQAAFKLSEVGETFDSDKITDQFFQGHNGPANAIVSANIHGPSFMFNVGKKSAVAITSRARVMANVVDIDGKLLEELSGDDSKSTGLPYTINSNADMRIAMNAWSEIGASYARILANKGKHFLKGGVTLKYLGGAGNAFLNIDNLKATINEDNINGVYLANTAGRIGVGFGGVNLSDFESSNILNMESSGFGADLGFVYEYRDAANQGNNQNKYKFKVGVALLDIGSVKYKKDMDRSGTYAMDINGGERFYLNDIEEKDLDDYNSFFRSRPQFFTPDASNNETEYAVSLPTSLNVDVDYHLHKGFYVSASGLFSLVGKTSKVQNSLYPSYFAVTPRVEGKIVGLYLPVTYNSLTNFNAGLSLRLGPLFVGSGSLITSLVGESKQVDVHVGLRFGSLYKK